MERPRRFFGERQTHRRISDLRGGQTGDYSEEDSRNSGTGASASSVANTSGNATASTAGSRGRGRFVSGYRRQPISYETSGKEGDSGEPSTKTHE